MAKSRAKSAIKKSDRKSKTAKAVRQRKLTRDEKRVEES